MTTVPHRRDPLERLELFTLSLAIREAYEAANRRGLLIVHGLGGICATLLLLADEPSAIMARFLGPLLLPFVVLPALGGFVLLTGILWDRKVLLELAGMVTLLVWDVAAAALFGFAARIFAHDGDPTTVPVSYPLAIYATLGALMLLHLRTAVQLLRKGLVR